MKSKISWHIIATSFVISLCLLSVNAQREPKDEPQKAVQPPSPPPRPLPRPRPKKIEGVKVFGAWPPNGDCDYVLAPKAGYQGLPDPICNDHISGVSVPFGMSIEICEHENGRGRCRRFLPGAFYVQDDMNDVGTSFKVERRMIGYLNSADYPVGVRANIGYSNKHGVEKWEYRIGYDGTWIIQNYSFPLPSNCLSPRVVETTKNGDASWESWVGYGHVLKIIMQVKPRPPFGSNNWVGIEVSCK